MDIVSRIFDVALAFRVKVYIHGDPTEIYLGRNEMKELKLYVQNFTCGIAREIDNNNTIGGMSIHCVDSENYLSVGISEAKILQPLVV